MREREREGEREVEGEGERERGRESVCEYGELRVYRLDSELYGF